MNTSAAMTSALRRMSHVTLPQWMKHVTRKCSFFFSFSPFMNTGAAMNSALRRVQGTLVSFVTGWVMSHTWTGWVTHMNTECMIARTHSLDTQWRSHIHSTHIQSRRIHLLHIDSLCIEWSACVASEWMVSFDTYSLGTHGLIHIDAHTFTLTHSIETHSLDTLCLATMHYSRQNAWLRTRLPPWPFWLTNMKQSCHARNTLHHTATHCNALQHTATRCNKSHQTYITAHTSSRGLSDSRICSRHDTHATHCNTLQHTATHCNSLQQISSNVHDSAHILRRDLSDSRICSSHVSHMKDLHHIHKCLSHMCVTDMGWLWLVGSIKLYRMCESECVRVNVYESMCIKWICIKWNHPFTRHTCTSLDTQRVNV